jgi:uncharacterized protein (DUF362 family)
VSWLEATEVGIIQDVRGYATDGVDDAIARGLTAIGRSWNDFVRRGDCVLLKPNLIRESHTSRSEEWEQIITNGAVIGSVARSVAEALQGHGRIVIADAPQTDSDFDRINARVGLNDIATRIRKSYPGVEVSVVDLRREVWRSDRGVVVARKRLADAPGGYTCVDLGGESCLGNKQGRYYGADYDSAFTQRHHSSGRHAYLLARLALDADVFINLPKLKTHKKVGVTISLKNLVGINGDKNYLPHFSMGTPGEGGDEFEDAGIGSSVQSWSIRAFKGAMRRVPGVAPLLGPTIRRVGGAVFGETEDVVRSGNWHGNDTAWRMVLDLNRILFHFDGAGQPRKRTLRYLSIVDGIVAGDGNGPMAADALPAGLLLIGENPVSVDLMGATLMGFDWRKIPTIREAFSLKTLPLAAFSPHEVAAAPHLPSVQKFRPHFGWQGHIEAGE